MKAKFCAFVISFPASLLSVPSLPLGSRAKVGRERGGHGPKTALKPQPLFKWGCLLVHYSVFPSSWRRKRRMWKSILVSFLACIFFVSFLFVFFFLFFSIATTALLSVGEHRVDKKIQVFLIFDSASVRTSIFLFVLKSPFICVCCTFTVIFHTVHVSLSHEANERPKSPSISFEWDKTGFHLNNSNPFHSVIMTHTFFFFFALTSLFMFMQHNRFEHKLQHKLWMILALNVKHCSKKQLFVVFHRKSLKIAQ